MISDDPGIRPVPAMVPVIRSVSSAWSAAVRVSGVSSSVLASPSLSTSAVIRISRSTSC